MSLSLSFPLPSSEFDPPQPVSSRVTAKAISLSWLWQEAWSVVVGSGGEIEEAERLRPDTLVWRPGATLRGPQPVTLKNDATLS